MSDRKKTRKRKKNNVVPLKNNVVPLKSDLQVTSNDNPVDARQAEINRINDHAKEVFNELGIKIEKKHTYSIGFGDFDIPMNMNPKFNSSS